MLPSPLHTAGALTLLAECVESTILVEGNKGQRWSSCDLYTEVTLDMVDRSSEGVKFNFSAQS